MCVIAVLFWVPLSVCVKRRALMVLSPEGVHGGWGSECWLSGRERRGKHVTREVFFVKGKLLIHNLLSIVKCFYLKKKKLKNSVFGVL